MKALKERSEAQAQRNDARARLLGTVAGVRDAATPSAFGTLLKASAKARATDIAANSAKAVQERPGIVFGALAGALLYLFRKPIIGAVSRLTKEKHDG